MSVERDEFEEEQLGVDDRDEREDRTKLRNVSDAVRKAVGSGIRSMLSSEEWVRSTVREALPKELVQYMKRQADSARDEVVRLIGVQTKRFIEGIDIGSEVQKILTSLSFEIKTEIRFIPNDQKVKPDVKVAVRTRKAKGRDKREPPEDDGDPA